MVTSRSFLWWAAWACIVGCGGAVEGDSDSHRYSGEGFVVHEWGTDTVVVGSDGSLARGLHHEEEDLPAFVYDRLEGGMLPMSSSVEVKMETPVTYFYSDVPRSVRVSVGFPHGVFTQWYPAVAGFYPKVADRAAVPNLTAPADPVLDVHFPFGSEMCTTKYGAVANGLLDWGAVEILPRNAHVDLPQAPLEEYSWSFARDVAANPVRISGVPGAMEAAETERFLFYRGLGNFGLPLLARASSNDTVLVDSLYDEGVSTLFVVNVDATRGAFAEHEGVAPRAALELSAASLESDGSDLDAFSNALGAQVTAALDRTGLYHDEAVAMVNTWKRQWFRTPGLRLLYLVPQSWTDASIPLSLDVVPDATVRVMMIRVELITPELEAADVAALAKLASATEAPEARTYFVSLGRFAEPRLRRAIALAGPTTTHADELLAEIASADTNQCMGQ